MVKQMLTTLHVQKKPINQADHVLSSFLAIQFAWSIVSSTRAGFGAFCQAHAVASTSYLAYQQNPVLFDVPLFRVRFRLRGDPRRK